MKEVYSLGKKERDVADMHKNNAREDIAHVSAVAEKVKYSRKEVLPFW